MYNYSFTSANFFFNFFYVIDFLHEKILESSIFLLKNICRYNKSDEKQPEFDLFWQPYSTNGAKMENDLASTLNKPIKNSQFSCNIFIINYKPRRPPLVRWEWEAWEVIFECKIHNLFL
jgi:hypothetical protein